MLGRPKSASCTISPVPRSRLDANKSGGMISPGFLARAEDGVMLVLLVLVPQVTGGRWDLGKLCYVVAVAVLTLLWIARQAMTSAAVYRWTGVEWLLLLVTALLVLQIAPLSSTNLRLLSPHLADILPLWFTSGDSATVLRWKHLSLTPEATKIGLIVFLAHSAFFLVTCQRLTSMDSVRRLLSQCAIAGLSLGGLGLLQYLSGTSKFAWYFPHPSRDASSAACGPFANPNHFAHCLALCLGPLLWWLRRSVPSSPVRGPTGNPRFGDGSSQGAQLKFMLVGLGLAVVLFAGGLSRSRGGMLAMGCALSVSLGLSAWARLIDRRIALACTAIALLFAGGLAIHGKDTLKEEFATLTSGRLEDLDQGRSRRKIWRANWEVAAKFPLVGTGVGSHAEAYPLVYEHPLVDYTHAESCYVQILTETGWTGAALLALGVTLIVTYLCHLRAPGDSERTACGIAASATIVTSLLHAAVDFPWYLTACVGFTIPALAMARVLARGAKGMDSLKNGKGIESTVPGGEPSRSRLVAWGLAGAGVSLLAISGIEYMLPWGRASWHWNQYLVLSLDNEARGAQRELLRRDTPEALAARARHEQQRIEALQQELELVLKSAPRHPRAHLKLSALLTTIFDRRQQASDNAMALAHIRDAAYSSSFASIQDRREWLRNALGDNADILRLALRHAQQGLRSNPLAGQGYLLWSELVFLDELSPEPPGTLLAQAERVRPFHAGVQFQLGVRAAAAQRPEDMLTHWRKAFHLDSVYATEIIRGMAPTLDAIPFLQVFMPEEAETTTLMYFYHKIGRLDQMKIVAPVLIQRMRKRAETLTGIELADLRLQVMRHCLLIGDTRGAGDEARRAVKAAPNQFEPHLAAATQALTAGDLAEAKREIQWCVGRRPSDERVRCLQASLRQQLVSSNVAPASNLR